MGKQRFTASEVARAVQACRDARLNVGAVEVATDGTIRIIAAQPKLVATPTTNPADLIDP